MFKKTSHAVRLATLGLISASAMMASQSVLADPTVSASLEVSNMYLWRGYDFGGGAVVAGDLSVDSGMGLYGGIWGSSGDGALGQEYDLYLGYGVEMGDISVDLSVWNYIYPSLNDKGDSIGDISDDILAVSAFGATIEYYKPIAGALVSGYQYFTLGYEMGSVGAKVGLHDFDGENAAHLDVSFAFNDEISFIFSQVISQDDAVEESAFALSERPFFKVSYSKSWDLE